MFLPLPFASKIMPDGKILKRRTIGFTFLLTAQAQTTYEYTVTYGHCKINQVEVFYCQENTTAMMRVRDSIAGTYSGVSNAILDTFGNNVNIGKDYWIGRSEYDADLYAGMVLEFVFNSLADTDKTIGINIILHEVV